MLPAGGILANSGERTLLSQVERAAEREGGMSGGAWLWLPEHSLARRREGGRRKLVCSLPPITSDTLVTGMAVLGFAFGFGCAHSLARRRNPAHAQWRKAPGQRRAIDPQEMVGEKGLLKKEKKAGKRRK